MNEWYEKCMHKFSRETWKEGIIWGIYAYIYIYEDNIKMDLNDNWYEDVDWTQGKMQCRAFMNSVINT
jgi:hypothetical protein